jgi:hypothetical protein
VGEEVHRRKVAVRQVVRNSRATASDL